MDRIGFKSVARVTRSLLPLVLFLGSAAAGFAQEAPQENDVRSADEIPQDMPSPPEDAPPAAAPPADGTDERPPHPETPEPLEEQQPSAETLAKTSYHWLPGHWVWTGEQFEWNSGEWVYKVKDMILVRPRWEWNGKQWVFHDAGWAPQRWRRTTLAEGATTSGGPAPRRRAPTTTRSR
jgi:type IV secretory pathway VirB10-like protein